jgi:ubiquinone/menaquinone biosynthesis C-methylase UbiE
VQAVGFDISSGQLTVARNKAERFRARVADGGIDLTFRRHDLCQALPWRDGHFHIVLCNYVVLNHLPKRALPRAIAELCRVSRFRVIATVRALAGPPPAASSGLSSYATTVRIVTGGS